MGNPGLMFFEWLLLIESTILGALALFAIGLICDPAAKVWLAERLAASAKRQFAASAAASAMKRAIARREREAAAPLPGSLAERERRYGRDASQNRDPRGQRHLGRLTAP